MLTALPRLFAAFLLRRQHFHVRFSVGRDLEVALWDRPGLYLSDADLARMVDDMRTVAREGQDGKTVPEYGALLGVRDDLARRVITLAWDKKTGQPVGFNALAYLDVRVGVRIFNVVHLGLIFVSPEHQKRALPALLYGLTTFLLFFKSGLRSYWVSNVTQVPAIAGLTAVHYGNVYPTHLPGGRQTFTHLLLAREIMRRHRQAFGVGDDAGFNEARQVITNAYTGGSDHLKKTFEDAPKHRDPRCNEMMRQYLDYTRGDDVLQLGVCNIKAILNYLSQRFPKGAVPSLLFQAISLVLLGLVIPVIGWLLPDQFATESAAPASATQTPSRQTPTQTQTQTPSSQDRT